MTPMLAYAVVSLVSLGVAALTLFSGFGLGTLLTPAFALFFPLTVAVAATAVVHLANNLFKLALVGRNADREVLARFALPGAVAAVAGALLLTRLGDIPPLATYALAGGTREVTPVKLVIGLVIVTFAVLDLSPAFNKLSFDRRYLPLGGLLSGFFGGLSGNQGALRSAFLTRAGLSKEAFVGTNVVSAVIVDVMRLVVYGSAFYAASFEQLDATVWGLVLVATLAAFLGSYTGAQLLKKVTIKTVQWVVAASLIAVGLALTVGLV